MEPLHVLLAVIGLLGMLSNHKQLLVHGWRRTNYGLVIPDPQDINITNINNQENMLNFLSVAAVRNGTDVKMFREGAQVIIRRYWYPNLVIRSRTISTTSTTLKSTTASNESTTTVPLFPVPENTTPKTPTTINTSENPIKTITKTPTTNTTNTTTKTPSANKTSITTDTTNKKTTITPTTTTATISTTTTPAVTVLKTEILRFSLDLPFTADLENTLSAAFIILAAWIEDQLDVIFLIKFSVRYNHCKVNSFQKGSVKVNATLFFTNTVPSSKDIENTLIYAKESNSTSLPVIKGSVFAGQSGSSSSSPSKAVFHTSALLLSCVLLISQTLLLI